MLLVYYISESAHIFLTWLLRAQLAGMLMDAGHNLVDQRGRLLPRSYDVLGDSSLHTTHYCIGVVMFVFQYSGYLL